MGVWRACVNRRPASSKHAFSSSAFWLHSIQESPVGVGAETIDNGWCKVVWFNALRMLRAGCLICSVVRSCFQRFFCTIPCLGLCGDQLGNPGVASRVVLFQALKLFVGTGYHFLD